ncbi:Protein OAC-3, partial [Aphelenchoides avenae]
SCYYGYGGPINKFMSHSAWVPLGKLSYSAYLLHWMVIVYFTGMQQTGWLYTSFPQVLLVNCLPAIAMTYFFSLIWATALEFSFGRVISGLT